MFDAAIIGGGPAGATAGRLLAQWGHSVTILTAAPLRHPSLAECLPPSTRKLFRFLEIENAIDEGGFFRTTGNTVWWAKNRRRTEAYPDGVGYPHPDDVAYLKTLQPGMVITVKIFATRSSPRVLRIQSPGKSVEGTEQSSK